MRIISVVGARPQFIKAAVLSRALRTRPGVEEVLVHTGQHYDEKMSAVFFQELEIPRPDYHLGVGSGTHGLQTGRMLQAIEQVLLEKKPDRVLVYGDTNTTLAGALAAAKLGIPVAHVEAGLRSFNRRMPEEINRSLTDHTSDLLFAPTELAVENLRREGIGDGRVHLVGDVMYDAALYYGARAEAQGGILERLRLGRKEYILASVHRPENTDDPTRLGAVCRGLTEVAAEFPVILPIHPRTRKALLREGILEEVSGRIRVIDPVGYLDMLLLEKNARLIATDSGGVQKEAFFCRVPCITLRGETEWRELVELGWNRLAAPTSAAVVTSSVRNALSAPMGSPGNPYGDGHSAERITEILVTQSFHTK